jgi:hypothetical protein
MQRSAQLLRSGALQSRDPGYLLLEKTAVPVLRSNASQELRAASRPGHESRAGLRRAERAWLLEMKLASAPYRLQTLEGQSLRVFDAGEIQPADEGRDLIAVAAGQNDDGVDGNPLGIHELPP